MSLKPLTLTLCTLVLCLTMAACGAAEPAETGGSAPLELPETLVSQVLLDQASSGYMEGECAAEGHIILDTVREDDVWQVYTLASVGQYGFCTGHFEKISGSGAIPTMFTIGQDENGNYVCDEIWEPEDGSYYADSIKETFPRKLWNKALNAHERYGELQEQEEAYAQAYLESIGREAPIGDYGDFEHPLFTENGMSVEVSNALLTIEKLYPFPMHIGNVERIEDGVRYVYETAWNHQGEGVGTAIYTKYEYDTNQVVQRYIFQVEGDTYTETHSQGPGLNASVP